MTRIVEVIEESTFDPGEFRAELARAAGEGIGTTHWYRDDKVSIWELRLDPGERAPFHTHTAEYWWICVAGGTARQRYSDGTVITRAFSPGDVGHDSPTDEAPDVHDLENCGQTTLQVIVVELQQ